MEPKLNSKSILQFRQNRWPWLMTAVILIFSLLWSIVAPVTPVAGSASAFTEDFDDNQLNPVWTVYNGSWGESGQILSQSSTSTVSPKTVILNGSDLDTAENQTIVAKVRVDSWLEGNANSRAGVSLFTGTVNGLGYSLLFARDHSTIRFLDGTGSWGPRYSFTWVTGSWYWFKLKMENETLYGKVWQDGLPEPTTWAYTWARSGRIGYPALYGGSYSASTASFDNVTVTNDIAVPAPTFTPLAATATPKITIYPPTSTPTAAAWVTPTTVTEGISVFTDGYGGDIFTAKDNLLNSASGAQVLNLGAHANFELSPTQNGMLEFDLSSIPATATLIDATLYLTNSYGNGGGMPISTVYSISQANQAWVAGTQSLRLALAGESCWDALAADGQGGVRTAWAGSEGANTPGVDYEAGPIGQWTWNPNTPAGTQFAIALDTQRVAGWLGADNTNYGILIKTSGGGGHVAQSSHTTASYRPRLVVRYTIN